MQGVLNWIFDRIKEPSTWAGIAVGATAIEKMLTGDPTAIVAVAAGLLAFVIPEKRGT